MKKQKTKFGWIEEMPDGTILGMSVVKQMSEDRELDNMTEYIDLGFTPISNEYKLAGGNVSSMDFVYVNEDGDKEYEQMPYISHGILVMKTTLTKHVST